MRIQVEGRCKDSRLQSDEAHLWAYAHLFRSGAGNYYSPSGLTQSGTFASSTAKHASTTLGNSVPSGQDATSSTPAAKAAAPFAGRGGAGNYSYSDERKQLEAEVVGTSVETLEGIEMRAISDNVTKDVDEALPRPQPAHVAPPDIWQGSNYGV